MVDGHLHGLALHSVFYCFNGPTVTLLNTLHLSSDYMNPTFV
jgi:hypothetical protein